ncbi:MAG: heavy-metal-associated domain-containing protein [Rhodobacteraceae bacterium]|nr:heavy-metal-associated domain-containing protein [Paracoccaceae bacterium]
MILLNVPDMSCGHCKSAVENAIKAVDPAAEITVDVDTKTVRIPENIDTAAVLAAMKNAGYPAEIRG